jgi:hypothetical protein
MQWKCFFGVQFICMAKRDFAINLITLHNVLEYMQIAITQTEAADFENVYLCHSQNVWPRLDCKNDINISKGISVQVLKCIMNKKYIHIQNCTHIDS